MSGGLPIEWGPRLHPLVPLAVYARGEAAAALLRRLLARGDAELALLSGVVTAASAPGARAVVVLGEAALLPWVDGVVYLGRDQGAPELLLPTALEPRVPAALLEKALLRRNPGLVAPLAVLPAPHSLLLAVGDARPLARARLLAVAA